MVTEESCFCISHLMDLAFSQLQDFFNSSQAQTTATCLKEGTEMVIQVEGASSFCLKKTETHLELFNASSSNPDMTFSLGLEAPGCLWNIKDLDIGSQAISIFKLMVSPQSKKRISVKVHADFLTLFKNGYFKVLTAGGPEVVRFLRLNGLGSLSKIKNTISQMKDK